MQHVTSENTAHLENSDVTTEERILAIREAEHRVKLEEKSLDDAVKAREHKQYMETREMNIREMTVKNEGMKMQFEENSKARQYDLRLKRGEKDIDGAI